MNNTLHIKTPAFESHSIGTKFGKTIFLKMECLQPAASFKIRGIGLLCKHYVESGITHLISSSGGNAGYAVAFAGKRLGVSVTVIIPETTPKDVKKKIEMEGAAVKVNGTVWDESHAYALKLTEQYNGAYIPPFDHPLIWQGHASLVDELVQQCEKPDAIILSVGGGGLLCGVVEGLQKNKWQDVPIIAVETEGAASLFESAKAESLITLSNITSIATSLGAKKVAEKAFNNTKTHHIKTVTVTDKEAVNACINFSNDHRILVEPACGAALSVVYNNAEVIKSYNKIIIIVCGGIGVSIEKLYAWQRRFE